MRFFPALPTVLFATVLATGAVNAGDVQLAQIIVKFRPGSVACDATGITAFAAATRLDLRWLRAMSGQACVLRLRAASPDQALAELQARPEVEWAQSDGLMRPQSR